MSNTDRNILIAIIAVIILWLLRNKQATTSVSMKLNGVPIPDSATHPITGANADSPDMNNTPPPNDNNQYNNAGFSQPITNVYTPNVPPPLPGPAQVLNPNSGLLAQLRANDAEF